MNLTKEQIYSKIREAIPIIKKYLLDNLGRDLNSLELSGDEVVFTGASVGENIFRYIYNQPFHFNDIDIFLKNRPIISTAQTRVKMLSNLKHINYATSFESQEIFYANNDDVYFSDSAYNANIYLIENFDYVNVIHLYPFDGRFVTDFDLNSCLVEINIFNDDFYIDDRFYDFVESKNISILKFSYKSLIRVIVKSIELNIAHDKYLDFLIWNLNICSIKIDDASTEKRMRRIMEKYPDLFNLGFFTHKTLENYKTITNSIYDKYNNDFTTKLVSCKEKTHDSELYLNLVSNYETKYYSTKISSFLNKYFYMSMNFETYKEIGNVNYTFFIILIKSFMIRSLFSISVGNIKSDLYLKILVLCNTFPKNTDDILTYLTYRNRSSFDTISKKYLQKLESFNN